MTPSTETSIPPKTSRLSPVAVTMTSAFSSRPEVSFSPFSVKVSIWSVTTSALPERSALKRSPPGTRQTRSSQGLYFGSKSRSMS